MARSRITARKQSLRDEVAIAIAQEPQRQGTWFSRLPPEHQKELAAIRDEWRAKKLLASARALSRSLYRVCSERGIPTCSVNGMREWLTRG